MLEALALFAAAVELGVEVKVYSMVICSFAGGDEALVVVGQLGVLLCEEPRRPLGTLNVAFRASAGPTGFGYSRREGCWLLTLVIVVLFSPVGRLLVLVERASTAAWALLVA